jgi:hypothetical protein
VFAVGGVSLTPVASCGLLTRCREDPFTQIVWHLPQTSNKRTLFFAITAPPVSGSVFPVSRLVVFSQYPLLLLQLDLIVATSVASID